MISRWALRSGNCLWGSVQMLSRADAQLSPEGLHFSDLHKEPSGGSEKPRRRGRVGPGPRDHNSVDSGAIQSCASHGRSQGTRVSI